MAEFRSKLVVEDDDGFPFILAQPLIYYSDLAGREITVPTGFKTDYASIPQLIWNLLPPVGRYDRAAVIHDFLFRSGFPWSGLSLSNRILNEAMGVLKVNPLKRLLIFEGVNLGGWVVWRKYRRGTQVARPERHAF